MSGGISSTETVVLAMSSTLMIRAAVESSFLVFRIRPAGLSSVSSASPRTSGMTATPVSKPESPRASFGKRITAIAAIIAGLPCCSKSDARQFASTSGCRAISATHRNNTTAFSTRYVPTRLTASLIASLNPRTKMAPRVRSSASVTIIG